MKKIYPVLLLLMGSFGLSAQVFIDTSYTAEQMVMDFFNSSCVTPSNITFTGGPVSMGFFQGAGTDLGLDAGIVLSTGDVTLIPGMASDFVSLNNGTAGDADLDAIVAPYQTFDAATLEFDILVAETGDLDFEYVFGSEEYPEYVGSAFNDVFAFFIDDGSTMENIATIPGTTDAVAINTVNDMSNSTYYVDNQGANGQDLTLDGFTTPLPATFMAMGNGMYHVKISLADAGDGVFDSDVFIGIQSLCGPMLLSPPTSFAAEQDGNTVTVTNESRYATSWHWDFGDGYETDERYPAPHEYTEDGSYTITLTTENYCCSETFTFEVQIGETVGVNEAAQEVFRLSPNPAEDFLLIELQNGQVADYQLTDITGRILMSGQINGYAELSLEQVPSGYYQLQVMQDGQWWSQRVLKR